MPFWPQPTQWADHVVYVPIEKLALCCANLGKPIMLADGSVHEMTVEKVIEHWTGYGDNLDAYILWHESSLHTAGIRYGVDGADYLSPYFEMAKLNDLLNECGEQATPAASHPTR